MGGEGRGIGDVRIWLRCRKSRGASGFRGGRAESEGVAQAWLRELEGTFRLARDGAIHSTGGRKVPMKKRLCGTFLCLVSVAVCRKVPVDIDYTNVTIDLG